MKEPDNQSRLPIPVTQPKILSQGFAWISNRRSFIKTRRFSGISSVLTLPLFMLEFFFLALLIALLLLIFAFYIVFNLLISLPRLKRGN